MIYELENIAQGFKSVRLWKVRCKPLTGWLTISCKVTCAINIFGGIDILNLRFNTSKIKLPEYVLSFPPPE